jgi:hypothetical protein
MRLGFTTFCIFIVLAWLAMALVSVQALGAMDIATLGPTFLGDFAHPWRAVFNTDLTIHLALLAAWMIYRAASWPAGLACAALAISLGALFTLPYLVLITIRARGDMRRVMLGSNFVG